MNETGRPQDFPLSNPRADRVRKVAQLAGRPARLKRREFLAEGPQAVREALVLHQKRIAAGEPGIVYEVYASESCLDRHPDLEALAEGTTAYLATDEVLAAMADTVTPQGILAVCGFLDVSLEQVLDAGPRLIAVLCQVRDPGNAGTVLRAADAAGADAVVLTASSVDIYNPKAVRSTAGSLFHLPVVLGAEIEELVARCKERGIGVLAADGQGQLNLDRLQDQNAARRLGARRLGSDYALESPTAWLFGNEAQGLVRGRTRPGGPPGGRARVRGRRKPQPGHGGDGLPLRQRPLAAGRRNSPAAEPRRGAQVARLSGGPERRQKAGIHRRGSTARWAPAVVRAVQLACSLAGLVASRDGAVDKGYHQAADNGQEPGTEIPEFHRAAAEQEVADPAADDWRRQRRARGW